jgi:hypothetical protein
MPRSGQTKDYNSGICCFTDAHAALRRMNKDWLDLAEKSNDLLITIAIGRLKMTSNNPSNPMHMSSVGERVIVT